jgi:hypothetical protein
MIKAAEIKDEVIDLEVGTWNLESGLHLKDDLFPHVTGGLRGKVIKIGSINVSPFSSWSFVG